jgi:hypothetical protein
VANRLIAPHVAGFQQANPGITLVLSGVSGVVAMDRGEADLAVRLLRPEDPDLVAPRDRVKVTNGNRCEIVSMRQNLISVSADGLEAHEAYLDLFRAHVDELAAQGIEYEEQDRRADPLTLSLLVTVVVTSAVTTAVGEVIKKIISAVSDRSKATSAATIVQIEINGACFVLPADQERASAEIDALETR